MDAISQKKKNFFFFFAKFLEEMWQDQIYRKIKFSQSWETKT